MGNCEMCSVTSDCYDVPSYSLDMDVDEQDFVTMKLAKCPACEGTGGLGDTHGQGFDCPLCKGTGRPVRRLAPWAICDVEQCQRRAMPNRKICENHAFPAARPKESTGRRAAIAATKKKLAAEAKVSDEPLEE